MEEKTGRERSEAIKQINDDEELRVIASEDPNAILLHDPEGSVISNIATGDWVYENNTRFLAHRLEANDGSLDKLCEELDYSPYDFLTDSCANDNGESFSPLINEAYDGERLGDLYAR